MQDLNVIMTDISAGRFGTYIPVIMRHMSGIEVERIIHAVPPEHMGHLASMHKLLRDAAREAAEKADLIIIPGGIDINPELVGQERGRFTEEHTPLSHRDEIETIMIETALERDTPIIHICRGHQLALAVMLKGKEHPQLQFCQHLPDLTSAVHRSEFFMEGRELLFNTHYIRDEFSDDLKAARKSPITEEKHLVHPVRIYPGTNTHILYQRALGLAAGHGEPLDVCETSHHHQGWLGSESRDMPDNLVCSAISLAGDEVTVIEGFERSDHSLCIGFQWHLEANASGVVGTIFRDIADYARFKKQNRDVSFKEWAERH